MPFVGYGNYLLKLPHAEKIVLTENDFFSIEDIKIGLQLNYVTFWKVY
jgi:hypothetical protein